MRARIMWWWWKRRNRLSTATAWAREDHRDNGALLTADTCPDCMVRGLHWLWHRESTREGAQWLMTCRAEGCSEFWVRTKV